MERREFLQLSGGLAIGSLGVDIEDESISASALALPKLPYDYGALEPYIDAKTMRLHHTKHHAGYLKGLQKAEAHLAKAREMNDFSLIQHWSKQAAFHGGGFFLHSMFWTIMAPPKQGGGGKPSGSLMAALVKSFGSYEAFQKQFSAAARAVEGSGWALLHYRPIDDSLHVLQVENQHKLSPWGTVPLMGIDVWEHAYYLKYENKRAEYIKAWWNVVNWAQVGKNFDSARKNISK